MKPEDYENDMEVRITALLLGELTAEEEAEVRAAVAQDAELMRLHDRLKVVMGLVRDAVPTTELPANVIPEPLTLANERREELLAVFQGKAPKVKEEEKIVQVSFWQRYQKDLMKLAAMVVALFGVTWLMLFKRETQLAYLDTTTQKDVLGSGDEFMRLLAVQDAIPTPAPAAPAPVVMAAPMASSDMALVPLADVYSFTNTMALDNASSEFNTTYTINLSQVERLNGVTANSVAASAVPDSSPRAEMSSRTPSPAERPLDRARNTREITLRRRGAEAGAAAAPSAAPVESRVTFSAAKENAAAVRFSSASKDSVPQAQSVGGVLMGAPQTASRSFSIALPEPEMAQVKELSDLTADGAVQMGQRGDAFGRGVNVTTGGGSGSGEAMLSQTKANNKAWGFTGSTADARGRQSGLSPEAKPSAPVAGDLPMLGTLFGNNGIAAGAKAPNPSGNFSVQDLDESIHASNRLEVNRGLADGSSAKPVMGERFYRETASAPVPSQAVSTKAEDKVDAWRQPREDYLGGLAAKGRMENEFRGYADGSQNGLPAIAVNSPKLPASQSAQDRLARVDGLSDQMSIANGTVTGGIALPATPARPMRPALGGTTLNFTTSSEGRAKADVVTPGAVVMSGRVEPELNAYYATDPQKGLAVVNDNALGDAQKNVWYDTSAGIGGEAERKNRVVGRHAWTLPQGTTLDLDKVMAEAKEKDGSFVVTRTNGGNGQVELSYSFDAPMAGKPVSGVVNRGGGIAGGAGISPELSGNNLPPVALQGAYRAAQDTNALASDFGVVVNRSQMGREVDGDVGYNYAKKLTPESSNQGSGDKDLKFAAMLGNLNTNVWVGQNERTTNYYNGMDRFGTSVPDGRKLNEQAPVRMSLLEDVALPSLEEAAKRQATETLVGETLKRAEGLKESGNLAEAEMLQGEAAKLRKRITDIKGEKQQFAQIEKAWEIPSSRDGLPTPNPYARTNTTQSRSPVLAQLNQEQSHDASDKVEGWRKAREEYLSQVRAKEMVGGPLDKEQKEIDRLSDRRVFLEREATLVLSKAKEAEKQLQAANANKSSAEIEKWKKESEAWSGRVKGVETETAQVDAQIEVKLTELRKLAAEAGPWVLAAGDPIQVFVVEDESLNSYYEVQKDGYVVLPKIGRVQVAGKDLPDAEKAIKEALQASQLSRATVMVERLTEKEVKEFNAKKAKEEEVAKKPVPAPPGIPQPEVSTAENAFSTFSLNVSDVSFKLAAASLEKGLMPELGSVRTEEFINAFNYHDPEPASGSRVSFAWERARYPFAHDRDLVRFSVQTAAIGREPGKPLNIVLLLDNSGSMERADRIRIRQECLRVLGSQLQPQDKVSVVSFARTARLWVDGMTGAHAKELPERVGNLSPEGGTNLEEAMNLAYQTAQRHFVPNGVNRVVLLTDGAANLGEVQPESLKKKVVSYRQQGVALDCFGIGWDGYNDDLLEALSRNGDGRYGFVNSPEAATTEFAAQLSGALKVAASDVKVQVEWNPKRVKVFRQLGYAMHQLKKEEFRDNTVDAAEIGAAEAGNALYTVQVNSAGEGPLGVVRVRYRLPGTNDYREQEWPLAYDGASKSMEQASVPIRLAGTASAFSEWLVSSPYAAEVTPEKLIAQMAGVPEAYPADPRPKQLEWMIRQAKSLSGR
ncbi:MAG TPA: von Willebrand factor type A domain-containing protein [Verrucomicrobiae bacterium]